MLHKYLYILEIIAKYMQEYYIEICIYILHSYMSKNRIHNRILYMSMVFMQICFVAKILFSSKFTSQAIKYGLCTENLSVLYITQIYVYSCSMYTLIYVFQSYLITIQAFKPFETDAPGVYLSIYTPLYTNKQIVFVSSQYSCFNVYLHIYFLELTQNSCKKNISVIQLNLFLVLSFPFHECQKKYTFMKYTFK